VHIDTNITVAAHIRIDVTIHYSIGFQIEAKLLKKRYQISGAYCCHTRKAFKLKLPQYFAINIVARLTFT